MTMHDIWNPWHGCKKISEGCDNCYMYYADRIRGRDGADVYRTQNFDYPLSRDRRGAFHVKSGETLRVCMNSDFFLEEADKWRNAAWDIMRARPDVIFFLLTKRPQRVYDSLPADWGEGWENIFFNVTCENQRRADERMPILLELPFKHKGVMCAPFIGPVSLAKYLESGQIERVTCGGENYDGARPCNFDWVIALRNECVAHETSFCLIETGNSFIKNGKSFTLQNKRMQSEMACRSGVNYQGKKYEFKLTDPLGLPLAPCDLYRPHFCSHCEYCGSRPICNGCRDCGKCQT